MEEESILAKIVGQTDRIIEGMGLIPFNETDELMRFTSSNLHEWTETKEDNESIALLERPVFRVNNMRFVGGPRNFNNALDKFIKTLIPGQFPMCNTLVEGQVEKKTRPERIG